MSIRVTTADALHKSGDRDEARELFAAVERMQQECQPKFDLLYSLAGFRDCDLLLAPADADQQRRNALTDAERTTALDACTEAERRARSTVRIAQRNEWLLDIG